MKEENMKKPLKGEKTGFRHVPGKIKLLFTLFLISSQTFPQVPINGFCRYQSFNIDSGFSKLFSVNYNNDSYTDLMIFNPSAMKLNSIDGAQNGTFVNEHSTRFSNQISEVQDLWNRNDKIYTYGFISRKLSEAGIFKFNAEGSPILESEINFNSYPENLSTADINGDGVPELLISGSTFDGLSIVYQEKKLREKKIAEKTSFSESAFIDLNNDDYPDIAAFEMFSNKLLFFYNNSKGNFNKVREIPLNQPITSLQATDINLDSYSDILFSYNNCISIYFGDFSSSYEDTVEIKAKYKVDKLITGDFNRDGKIDIAYLNREEGILSLLFAKDEKHFYPELIYLKKDSLCDIIPYYSKFINGIALVSENGKLDLISNLSSFSDDVSIVAGALPQVVSFFDKDNNSINDLCYVDGFNKTLNLLLRSNFGIPENWFSIPMFENETSVFVSNKNPVIKTFYCYSRNKKLIEVFKVDFNKYTYSRTSLYSPGLIKDLKYKPENEKLYVAFIKNKSLGVSVFVEQNGAFSTYSYSDIKGNAIDAALSVYNNPEVYYAASLNDSLVFGEKELIERNKYAEIRTDLKSDYDIILYAGNFINKPFSALYGFLGSDKKQSLILYMSHNNLIISGRSGQLSGFRIKDKNQLFFGELRFNNPGTVCFFNSNEHSIKSLGILEASKKINRNVLMDSVNVKSFFIKNMNTQKYHLIYIDNIQNCITIKELK
jgi:FG-GAP-like repeat